MPDAAPLIAVINSDQAVATTLRDAIVEEGYRAEKLVWRSHRSPEEVVDFLRRLGPELVVYHVGPPYRESWQIFVHVRHTLPDLRFVLMATTPRMLADVAGDPPAYQVIDKPFDLDQLFESIERARHAPPAPAPLASPSLREH